MRLEQLFPEPDDQSITIGEAIQMLTDLGIPMSDINKLTIEQLDIIARKCSDSMTQFKSIMSKFEYMLEGGNSGTTEPNK